MQILVLHPRPTESYRVHRDQIMTTHRQNQAWWYTLVIPALRRLRQEDHEVEANMDRIEHLRLARAT
jgi:hypothetical protein